MRERFRRPSRCGETMSKIRIIPLTLMLASAAVLAVPAQAQLFGPSKEEVERENRQDAAAVELDGRITDQSNKINALSDRVRDLEDSLRQATGRNETLQNQVNQLSQQLDR